MTLGNKQAYKNMVVFPLFNDQEVSIDYILLDEATDANRVVISEDFEDGIVTELTIENASGENILILEGDELIGTKQRRSANTTMLIPAHSVVAIPVSCVERRRWYYQGRGMMSKDRVLLKRNIAVNESLPSAESLSSANGETRDIWEIASKDTALYHVDEPTRIIDNTHPHDQQTIDDYLRHVKVEDNQVGFLIMGNNKIVGCEYVGKYDTLSKTFSKLMTHYILDTMDTNKMTCPLSARIASGFLNDIRLCTVKGRPSLSLGTDLHLESRNVTGSALSFGKELIHLIACNKDGKGMRKKDRWLTKESKGNPSNVSSVT